MSYKYFIDKVEGGYTFALYPNNNNRQFIGTSNTFKTYQEAKNNLEQFQGYVTLKGREAFDIIKENNKCIFVLKQNEYGIEFVRLPYRYDAKENAQNGISCILTNINAPLKIR